MKLIGKSVRTNNAKEYNKNDGLIFPLVIGYFQGQMMDQIPRRKTPGTTYCCYTDYESDYNGDYTYFIGEEVSDTSDVPEGFQVLDIPEQTYVKYTTPPEPMPDVLTNAWKYIWDSSEEKMGGKRNYLTDFEVYDERASDHSKIVMDICIGIS